MKFLKTGLGSEAWMMPCSKPVQYLRLPHGTSCPANGRTFCPINTRVGFDVLIGQSLANGNVLMGLRFSDLLKVRIGIENRAGSTIG